MNVTVWPEFELTVQSFNHYTTRTALPAAVDDFAKSNEPQ